VIQQFQPTYDPPLNTESEPTKPPKSDTKNQSDAVPTVIDTVIQMPYTIVTKMTPITSDMPNHDKT
jgi:hypothetical protein